MPSRTATSHRPRAPRVRGFTLLEILLALALMALMMVGVWGALRGATRLTHAADAIMARSESVRTAQQFLRRYVGMAAMQPFVTGRGEAARMFEGSRDSMRFVAPLPRQSGHAGLYVLTIKLADGDDGTQALELAYVPYAGNDASDAKPVAHRLLADVQGARFEYLAAAAFGKPAGWRDDWRAANGLPLAVRIHLDPAWPARVPFPDMVIPVHSGDGLGTQGQGAR